ncbi:MAG: SapC family protein [Pseudomonadota bacterium]
MSDDNQTTGNSAEQNAFPLFYTKPEALSPERHGDLKFDANAGFAFASKTHVVPLNVAELAAAARFYPVVFIGDKTPVPVAVLGLRKDENLFVNEDGSWVNGAYIPAYVRRYPFVFVTDDEQTQFSLCIDRDAPHIVEDGGVALFEGEETSEATKNALEFCRVYQAQVQGTQSVGASILEKDLLITNQANISLASGEQLSVTDFRVVDEKKLNELSDEDFLDLRKSGALAAIYCQMISTGNWSHLIEKSSAAK